LINIGWYFYTIKIQNPVLKYPVFIKTSKIFKIKNVFCFQKFSKNIFENIVDFSAFVLSKWINIWLYFYTVRIQTQY